MKQRLGRPLAWIIVGCALVALLTACSAGADDPPPNPSPTPVLYEWPTPMPTKVRVAPTPVTSCLHPDHYAMRNILFSLHKFEEWMAVAVVREEYKIPTDALAKYKIRECLPIWCKVPTPAPDCKWGECITPVPEALCG